MKHFPTKEKRDETIRISPAFAETASRRQEMQPPTLLLSPQGEGGGEGEIFEYVCLRFRYDLFSYLLAP